MTVTDRTDNPLLKDVENRAKNAIEQRRKNAPTTSSVSITTTIWAAELNLEIGTQMVNDVRADVERNIRRCCVCYMIAGDAETTHKSGGRCTRLPLQNTTTGWQEFKDSLQLVEGLFCFMCLLPTVRYVESV